MPILDNFNKLLLRFRHLEKFSKIKLPLTRFAQIQELPFSCRNELRGYKISIDNPRIYNVTATSGSTNSRLLVAHSRDCYFIHLNRLIHIYKSIGVKKGDVCLNLCSYSLNGGARLMEAAFKEIGVLVIPFGEISTKERIADAIEIVRKFNPNIMNSYVNQVYDIFSLLKRSHVISKCIVNGERLLRNFKESVEHLSGVKIHNNYGSMEFSGFAIAQKNDDEFMRIFDQGLYIEVIKSNGKVGLVGEGEVVITDLMNYSFPFIRYILGDVVEIIKRKGGRYIKIVSRNDDCILLNGEINCIKMIENLAFSIIKNPNYFFVILKEEFSNKDKIILNFCFSLSDNEFMKLKNKLRNKMPFVSEIRVSKIEMPKTGTGKFKHVLDLRK